MKKFIQDLHVSRESHSFVDCLYAVLSASELYEGPKYLLSGMTTMAFKFTAHRYLLPSSVTAYGQWPIENWLAVDLLGIASDCYAGHVKYRTFPLYKRLWIDKVRRAIDQGLGCIIWVPEFGVVRGYDDEDRVFFVTCGHGTSDIVMLYDNLGMNTVTPYCFYQIVGPETVEIDRRDIYLDSLVGAVREWETPFKTTSREYAHGQRAYEYMLDAFENREYDHVGAAYLLHSYAVSKSEIQNYMAIVSGEFQGLHHAADLYKHVATFFGDISRQIDYARRGAPIDDVDVPNIVKHLKSARVAEQEAIENIKSVVRELMETMPVPVILEEWKDERN